MAVRLWADAGLRCGERRKVSCHKLRSAAEVRSDCITRAAFANFADAVADERNAEATAGIPAQLEDDARNLRAQVGQQRPDGSRRHTGAEHPSSHSQSPATMANSVRRRCCVRAGRPSRVPFRSHPCAVLAGADQDNPHLQAPVRAG